MPPAWFPRSSTLTQGRSYSDWRKLFVRFLGRTYLVVDLVLNVEFFLVIEAVPLVESLSNRTDTLR